MTKARADLLLLIMTVFWGASYILTKVGLEFLQPYTLTALRFLIAFLVSAAFFPKQTMNSDRKTVQYALILALILFAVFVSMTFGLKYTSASNAGFLISLSVVLIPVISSLFLKQKIEKQVVWAVAIAPIGIALLTLDSTLSLGGGDFLCILCAMLFALHVVATGVFTQRVNSIALGVWQLGFVGLLSIIFAAFSEDLAFPSTAVGWFVVLALSIICTAIGYIVQTTAQQYTSATHTGLILALEPVFSAIFAYIFLGEVLSFQGYVGAVILLGSVLLAEIDTEPKKYPIKRDSPSDPAL